MSERVLKARPFQDYIETFDLWKPLTMEQRALLAAHTHYRHCTKGEIIHRGALGHLGTLHIVSGTLRVYVVTDEGRELTLCFMRVGEVALLSSAAFLGSVSCEVTITAAEDTELFSSEMGVCHKILEENIHARLLAYESAVHRLSEMLWRFQQMLFTPADQRLAKFLLAETERTAGSEIRLTHEQTAQALGTAREVVSRLIGEFAQEGIVRASRGCIHILDRAALRRRADEGVGDRKRC